MKNEKAINKLLESIAQEIASIETLDTQNSDSLDFHDLAVWTIKKMLRRAYDAGVKSQQK